MAGKTKTFKRSIKLTCDFAPMRRMAGSTFPFFQRCVHMSFLRDVPFYRSMAGITAFSSGTDDLIGVIRGMVLMAFLTITLNKRGMKDGQTLFHVFMAIKAMLPSLFREKEFVRGGMRIMAVITLPSLGGCVHIYLFKLLRGFLMACITKPRQCLL